MKSYHDEERREGALGLKITSIQEEKLEEDILASGPARAEAVGVDVGADTFHSKAVLGQQGNLIRLEFLYFTLFRRRSKFSVAHHFSSDRPIDGWMDDNDILAVSIVDYREISISIININLTF